MGRGTAKALTVDNLSNRLNENWFQLQSAVSRFEFNRVRQVKGSRPYRSHGSSLDFVCNTKSQANRTPGRISLNESEILTFYVFRILESSVIQNRCPSFGLSTSSYKKSYSSIAIARPCLPSDCDPARKTRPFNATVAPFDM